MPTFQFYKNNNKVAEFTGANPARLEELVRLHKTEGGEDGASGSGSGSGAAAEAPGAVTPAGTMVRVMRPRIHTCKPTQTQTHTHTDTYTHRHIHTHRHIQTHRDACAYAYPYANANTDCWAWAWAWAVCAGGPVGRTGPCAAQLPE
jgi:hypothetical protein